jgi:hypothetical protein
MPETLTPGESLFSYGTLQLEPVQVATFGRTLAGAADSLPGFELSTVKIEDPVVVETSGTSRHPIVRYTGRAEDVVRGTVLRITAEELRNADRYEVAAYKRVSALLGSGLRAWVYVDVLHAPPDPVTRGETPLPSAPTILPGRTWAAAPASASSRPTT